MDYRILYVEDEQILGQLVTEFLTKLGYQVTLVNNGYDALPAFKKTAPHLCLLDIMLPGKDGYDVASQIRALDSKVPLIFLTAKVQVADVVAGFKTGCSDYIRKPFSMDELEVRIASWLAEKYSNHYSEVTEYTAGGYTFLPAKQLLVTPAGNQELSFKETSILTVLFAHANQVVGRNYLMQKVWESETVYISRSLDVYINRIRKHFANTPTRILTLRGVGFKLITG